MSEQETFDTDNFLDTQTEQHIDTTYEPIPEGDYAARISDDATAIVVRNGFSAKTGNPWYMMDIRWVIDDPDLAEQQGRDPVTVHQSIFLDITEQGGLDQGKGRNRQLGFLRETLGQNIEGQPWSPRMMQGAPALINVGGRPDRNDPTRIYDEVKRVAVLS